MAGVLLTDSSTFVASSSTCDEGGEGAKAFVLRAFVLRACRAAGGFVSCRTPLFGTRLHDAAGVERFDSNSCCRVLESG
jgi:hypothetical protein